MDFTSECRVFNSQVVLELDHSSPANADGDAAAAVWPANPDFTESILQIRQFVQTQTQGARSW